MISKLEEIKTLLREEWDPIGFVPLLPLDEYDGFAWEVWTKFSAGASIDEVTAYLTWAAGVHIGVDVNPARERLVAELAARIMGLHET